MAISTIGTSSISALGYGFKNRLINGACVINQRVSSLSTNNSQGYYIDRMWGFSGASTAATYSQQSSSGLTGFPYFIRAQRTAGNTGTAGIYTGQIVESNNLQDLQGQSVTFSFWARCGSNFSGASSQLTVWLRTGTTADQGLNTLISPGWAGAVDQTSNVTLTTSWQYFSKTFTVASNTQELTAFVSYAGVGTAGTNDYYDVTGMQLELGSVATGFDFRPYGTELQLAQRYYQTYAQPPLRGAVGGSNNMSRLGMILPVVMRVAPTVVVGALPVFDGTSTGTISSVIGTYYQPFCVEFDCTVTPSTFTTGRVAVVYQSGSTSMTCSAEL